MEIQGALVGYKVHNTASTNIETSAYVEVYDSIPEFSEIEIFNETGSMFYLAAGAGADAQIIALVHPGGLDRQKMKVSESADLYMKAIDANATTGRILISLWR